MIYLYELSEVGKFIEKERKSVVAKGRVSNVYRVFLEMIKRP